VLIPHKPGQYVLTASADLVQTDAIEPSVKHAEATLTLTVAGSPIDTGSSSGCSISEQHPTSLLVVVGLGLLMLWRRRR